MSLWRCYSMFDVDKYLKILFDDEIVTINELNMSDDGETDVITEDNNTSTDIGTLINNWMKYVKGVELTTKPFTDVSEFKDIVQWILVKTQDNNITVIPIDKNGKTSETVLQKHYKVLRSASSSVTGAINTLKSQLNVIGFILPTYIKIQFKDKFLNKITQTNDLSDLKTKIPLDEFKTFYIFVLYNVNVKNDISIKQIKQLIKNEIDPNGKILKDVNNQRLLKQFHEFLLTYGNKSRPSMFKFDEFEVPFNPQELTREIQTTTQNSSTEETNEEEKDVVSTGKPKKFTLYQKPQYSIVPDEEFVGSGQLFDDTNKDMILQFVFEMNSNNMSQDSVQLKMFKQIVNKLYKIQIIDTKDQEQVIQLLFTILLYIGKKDIGLGNNTLELYNVLSNERIVIDNSEGLTKLSDLFQRLQLDLLVQDIEEYTKTKKLDTTIFLNLLYEDFKDSSFYNILRKVSKYVDSNAPIYVIQNEEIMKQLQNGKLDQNTFLSRYPDEQQKYFIRLVLAKSGETKFTPDVIVIVPLKQNVIKTKSVSSIGNYNYYVIDDGIKEHGTLNNQFISKYNIKYVDTDIVIKPVELQFVSNSNGNTLLSNSQYVVKFEGSLNNKDIDDIVVDTVDNPLLTVDLDREEIGFGGIFGFSIKTVGDAGARLGRLLHTIIDEDIPTIHENKQYTIDNILQTVIKDNKDIIHNILYENDKNTLKYITTKQFNIISQRYGITGVYNIFKMLSESLFKNKHHTKMFLENIVQQIMDDNTFTRIIVDSYYNGNIDENILTNIFVESLSEILFERWVSHVIMESEEHENNININVSNKDKQTIVSKVNSLWNTYIYKSVTEKNSKYKFSLSDLYNPDTIKQLQSILVEQFQQLSENKQNEIEIIKFINSIYVDLHKELILPVYNSTGQFINTLTEFVEKYISSINIDNVDELNKQIKLNIINQVRSMISKRGTESQVIRLPQIPENILNNCDLTENVELYNIVKELVNKNDNNIKSLSTFIYNKVLRKITYLLFLIKLYTQYITNVLLLVTVQDYNVFIESIFIQGAKQFNTVKVFDNDNMKTSLDYKQLIQHQSEQSKSFTNQSTNNISLYFVKYIKVNIPLFILSIQSSEKLISSIEKNVNKLQKQKKLNITNTEAVSQFLTSLTKNMISMEIKKVGRSIDTVEQDTDKIEDTIDKLLNKLSSSQDILKLSKLTSNSDIVTILKTDENILNKYLLYNLYTNTDLIQKLMKSLENELYDRLLKTNPNKVYIVKTYIKVKYQGQEENSLPLQITDTNITISQMENAISIINDVIVEFYKQLVSGNVCQLLLWQNFNDVFYIITSSGKKKKSSGSLSADRITVSVSYNQAIQLSIQAESDMYIDLKFVIYPFDMNNNLENPDTIQNVKPIVITPKELPQLKNIKVSRTSINFTITLTLKTEIRSGTFSQDENIRVVVGKIFTDLGSGFELIMPLYTSKVKLDDTIVKNLDNNLQDILDSVVDYIKGYDM